MFPGPGAPKSPKYRLMFSSRPSLGRWPDLEAIRMHFNASDCLVHDIAISLIHTRNSPEILKAHSLSGFLANEQVMFGKFAFVRKVAIHENIQLHKRPAVNPLRKVDHVTAKEILERGDE